MHLGEKGLLLCAHREQSPDSLAQRVTQFIFLNEDLGLQLLTLTSRGHHIMGLIVPQGLHLLRVARTDPCGHNACYPPDTCWALCVCHSDSGKQNSRAQSEAAL